MQAVADYAERLGPPPIPLKLWFDFQQWGVLPRAGGLRDQLYGQLEQMSRCAHFYAIWRIFTKQPERWKELSRAERNILFTVREIRKGRTNA